MFVTATFLLYLATGVHTLDYTFPKGFRFGAATAAYQVEGGWNASDKSPSMWDLFVHKKPEAVLDHSNADVACDSYHQWERDVEMATELGLHFYRILPTGFSNHISKDGVQYYNNLINGLLKNNIKPVVTIYHYDLPLKIFELGGWENSMIVDWFADYAKILYTLFGDRVKTWLTFNEPLIFCAYSFNTGNHPPSILSPGIGDYICLKNVMLAHAKAWRIYDEEFKPKYKGKVAILNQIVWNIPEGNDTEAAEAINQYGIGMYSHPIYSNDGGWPSAIEEAIAIRSKEEGYSRSRLPKFTDEEIQFVKGTYDFYGFNYYTSRVAHKAQQNEAIGAWPLSGAIDLGIAMGINPEWFTNNKWFSIYPKGIREALGWIKKNYGDVEIFIAENGYLSTKSDLNDKNRVLYIRDHLEQILLAIKEDQVNITAYTIWSLMDNFDWDYGYTSMFGLYAVDFKDPNRTRTPRMSAHYYAKIIRNHSLIPLDWSTYTEESEATRMLSSYTLVLSLFIFIYSDLF